MDKLQVKYINPKELKPWAKNPRINDKAAEKLSKLIERFGFVNPIICDKDGTVRAGHTRLKAALKLGLETVPVIYKDFSNDSEAVAFALADNKSNEWAEWDFKGLEIFDAMLLKELDFNMSDIEPENIEPPDLKEGDREPFRQMTFVLHDSQYEIIEQAIKDAKQKTDFSNYPNENSNGNALFAVCEKWLAQKI